MRKFLAILVLLFPSLLFAQNYATIFSGTESPLSESSNWVNGSSAGSTCGDAGGSNSGAHACWGNMQKSGNSAYGVDFITTGSMPTPFGDATAILTGTWGTNQIATIQAKYGSPGPVPIHEIEIRLRSSLSAHRGNCNLTEACNSGYEILCPVAGSAYGIQVVKWLGKNGPEHTGFEYLITGAVTGSTATCSNGDVMRASVFGDSTHTRIQVWKNNTLEMDVTDQASIGGIGAFTDGNPGIGSFTAEAWPRFGIGSFSASATGWGGILPATRAIDWGVSGLPPTLPNGETTANPWTPPSSRPTCTTVSTLTGIDTVMANCASSFPGGSVVVLSAGSYTLSGFLRLYGMSNVTLRGQGPMSTFITTSGATHIEFGASQYDAVTSITDASLPSGKSSLTISGGTPSVGMLAKIDQCNTGFSGSTCSTGTATDNGGVFVCGLTANQFCNLTVGSPAAKRDQQQVVRITSVVNNGDGTFTVGFSPALLMSNWSSSQTPQMSLSHAAYQAVGIGIEDMTFVMQNGDQNINFQQAYASWIKGIRIVGAGQTNAIAGVSLNGLIANNYIFAPAPPYTSAILGNINIAQDSNNLVINNILTGGIAIEGGNSPTADVIAYNYNRDVQNSYYQSTDFMHQAGSSFILREGNQFDVVNEDNTWGTHNLNTFFRNGYFCWDDPYVTIHPRAMQFDNFTRFENVIGNALGGTLCSTGYQGGDGFIYNLAPSDTLSTNSLMRWGNYDTFTGTSTGRFVSAEAVPATLTGNAAPYQASVPTSQTLPASFFMNSVTAKTNGGTGLNWWKVCTSWTTFPTSCASYTTPPFPTAGPDITSSTRPDLSAYSFINGHAYYNPARLAWKTLPVDTTYQNTYSITGSSYSGGTNTLTVSGLPAGSIHLMGEFTITGAAACNGTFEMSGSSNTTIAYSSSSLGTNACSGGTVKWPNVRQFDQRVFSSDPSGSFPIASFAPTSLTFAGQNVNTSSPTQTITLTNTGTTALSITSIALGGTNPTSFFQSNNCPVGGSLGISSSCTITVTFTPLSAGSLPASVIFTDGASDSPQTLTLSGTGIQVTGSAVIGPGVTLRGGVIVR